MLSHHRNLPNKGFVILSIWQQTMALLYSTKGIVTCIHCVHRKLSQLVIRPQECGMSQYSKHLTVTMATFIVLIGGYITGKVWPCLQAVSVQFLRSLAPSHYKLACTIYSWNCSEYFYLAICGALININSKQLHKWCQFSCKVILVTRACCRGYTTGLATCPSNKNI